MQTKPDIKFSSHDGLVLDRIHEAVKNSSPIELSKALKNTLKKESEAAGKRINLIASESITSDSVRSLLSDPIAGRMGGGQIGAKNRLFPQCDNIDEIEGYCIECFKALFGSKYCEHRLTTNMLAISLVYSSLVGNSQKIMSFSLPHGGDTSNTPLGPPGLLGIESYSIPYSPTQQSILWDEFYDMATSIKPRMVSISKTVSLFPIDTKRIKEIIKEWNGLLFVDAAHELGLIAGKVFNSPLSEGADILSGSIGKSFSGAQSGILLWNAPDFSEAILKTTFPILVSSYQINRISAITQAAIEMMEFGNSFMQQSLTNAKRLAQKLQENDVPVLFSNRGFTETHQILIDASTLGGGKKISALLGEANILCNQIISPKDTDSMLFDPSAIRLGTVIVTRQGMAEPQMNQIATIISDLIFERRNISDIKNEVEHLVDNHNNIYYCFENGLPPHCR